MFFPFASTLVGLYEHQLEKLGHLCHCFGGHVPVVSAKRFLGAVHDRLVSWEIKNVSVLPDELFCGRPQSALRMARRRDDVGMVALKGCVERHRRNANDEFYRRV